MQKPLRGVNLGGWLVLEKWITPSVFAGSDASDEYSLLLHATNEQKHVLMHHYDSFITEQDIAWLSAQDIESVRLPVGYGLFGDVPPFTKTVHYIDQLFDWAERYNVQVLLDLHTAPGSQNGNDHSGRAGDIEWHKNNAYITETLAVLERLAKRYGARPALLGISLLNEPSHTIPTELLEAFYKRAYAAVRPHVSTTVWLVFSDSFRPGRWRKRLPRQQYPGLYIDHHHYQLFSAKDGHRSVASQLRRARLLLPVKLAGIVRFHPVLIGEWSLGLRATKYQTLSSNKRNKVAAKYARAQLRAFSRANAWFFWTYKTETMDMWSYRFCHKQGWL